MFEPVSFFLVIAALLVCLVLAVPVVGVLGVVSAFTVLAATRRAKR